jgi:BASS family bile acid:Na+ symporter
VLVPLLAFALTYSIPVSDPLKISIILLGTAAGAPCLPKLAQFAHGNVTCSVGLMVLLMVVTIISAPVVLPVFLPGVRVDPLSIAVSLVVTMLFPLGFAFLVRERYREPAGQLQALMRQASNADLLLVLVTSLLANFQEIIGVIGALLGEPDGDTRSVLSLGTRRGPCRGRQYRYQSEQSPFCARKSCAW